MNHDTPKIRAYPKDIHAELGSPPKTTLSTVKRQRYNPPTTSLPAPDTHDISCPGIKRNDSTEEYLAFFDISPPHSNPICTHQSVGDDQQLVSLMASGASNSSTTAQFTNTASCPTQPARTDASMFHVLFSNLNKSLTVIENTKQHFLTSILHTPTIRHPQISRDTLLMDDDYDKDSVSSQDTNNRPQDHFLHSYDDLDTIHSPINILSMIDHYLTSLSAKIVADNLTNNSNLLFYPLEASVTSLSYFWQNFHDQHPLLSATQQGQLHTATNTITTSTTAISSPQFPWYSSYLNHFPTDQNPYIWYQCLYDQEFYTQRYVTQNTKSLYSFEYRSNPSIEKLTPILTDHLPTLEVLFILTINHSKPDCILIAIWSLLCKYRHDFHLLPYPALPGSQDERYIQIILTLIVNAYEFAVMTHDRNLQHLYLSYLKENLIELFMALPTQLRHDLTQSGPGSLLYINEEGHTNDVTLFIPHSLSNPLSSEPFSQWINGYTQ